MTPTEVFDFLNQFPNVETVEDRGNIFFFIGDERMLTWATLITNDLYDQYSDLDQPDAFRLNLGVSKASFRALEPDFATDTRERDHFFAHPDYGKMYWISVVNPGEKTSETVRKLAAEAHEKEAQRQQKRVT